MTALPDLSVAGAAVNQVFTVDFRNNIASATLGQMAADLSDVLVIYNLSQCNFKVTLTGTNRTFNLPSGVTSNPIPLSYNGTNDTGMTLTVKSIVVTGTPQTVSFDWFRPGEPILSAPAIAALTGSGSVSSLTITGFDTWVIQQDNVGTLIFLNTTTGQQVRFLAGDAGVFFGQPPSGTNQSFLTYDTAATALQVETPQAGADNGIAFITFQGATQRLPLLLGSSGTFGASGTIIGHNGQIRTLAPPILATGNQESGHFTFVWNGPVAGADWRFWVPFKTVMANVPSSITLSNTSNSNLTSFGADTIGIYGFCIHTVITNANAFTQVSADYVTVGN